MPISPEQWIDLLKLYGPMALFVFMVFVLLRRARFNQGLSNEQRRIQVFALVLVWLSIFVLAGIIVVAWWRINFPKEFVVSGTIQNLKYPEIITTDQELYLHRRFVAAPEFKYEWRFISPSPFTGTVVFRLQKKPSDTEVLRCEFPIRGDFYRGTVEIEYDREHNKMSLSYGGKKEEIPSIVESASGELGEARGPLKLFNPDVVSASELPKSKAEDLVRALDADDPLLRQVARRDLIALGRASIPSVERALTDPASSDRLIVGILSVLKDISPEAKQSLGGPARCAIAKAANDANPTLRAEAMSVLAAGVSPPSNCPASQNTILQSRIVTVPANLAWTNAGIGVQKGDVLSFIATGEIRWAKSGDATAGPDGNSRGFRATAGSLFLPVREMGLGGLIARVNKGKAFRIGAKATITMKDDGPLFLGINDLKGWFGNNSGNFNVTIKRSSP